MVFAIHFERFLMSENTFEAFAYLFDIDFMRLILSEKKERSLRIRFAIEFKLFRMIENIL